MSLKDWERTNRWLVAHQTSKEEIANLLTVGDRNLQDGRIAVLSADARMALAYGAALQFASAALAAAEYRPARGGDHHYRVIQTLALTIGWDANRIARLDGFRKKRNVSFYERAGDVTDAEADEILDLAVLLRSDLIAWLRTNHTELI